jgi:hypothetical protein
MTELIRGALVASGEGICLCPMRDSESRLFVHPNGSFRRLSGALCRIGSFTTGLALQMSRGGSDNSSDYSGGKSCYWHPQVGGTAALFGR